MGIFDKLFGNKKNGNDSGGSSSGSEVAISFEKTEAMRRAYWNEVGSVDQDVLTFLLDPAMTGGPSWPGQKQAYMRIQTTNHRGNPSVILATEGLSDSFNKEGNKDLGHALELYVESEDAELVSSVLSDVKGTWQFEMLYQTGLNAAHTGAFRGQYDQYGTFSFEAYDVSVPEWFINSEGRVGLLIGMPRPNTPNYAVYEATDFGVAMLAVTLITVSELEYIVKHGGKGRQEVIKRLQASGNHHLSDMQRASVI